MKDLLIKWAELEPERCLERRAGFSLTVEGSSIAPYVFKSQEADSEDLMRIQYTVQQAIVARGWYWELRYWPPKQKHKAEVADNMSEWLDNPAEALLSAYVKALEAQAAGAVRERSE